MFISRVTYLLLAVLIFSSCNIIKPISVTSVGNFKTINPLSRPEIRFDVGLKNPNKFSVTIEKMDIGITNGGPVLAKVSLLEGIQVSKKESLLVPVSLVPSMNDITSLFNSGVEAFFNGKKEQKFEVTGEVIIKKFIFRKRYEIKESIRL